MSEHMGFLPSLQPDSRVHREMAIESTGFTHLQLKAIETIFRQEIHALEEWIKLVPDFSMQQQPISSIPQPCQRPVPRPTMPEQFTAGKLDADMQSEEYQAIQEKLTRFFGRPQHIPYGFSPAPPHHPRFSQLQPNTNPSESLPTYATVAAAAAAGTTTPTLNTAPSFPHYPPPGNPAPLAPSTYPASHSPAPSLAFPPFSSSLHGLMDLSTSQQTPFMVRVGQSHSLAPPPIPVNPGQQEQPFKPAE
eukprot:c45701_g1_i1.p1 GENE.c45701_g1_i1~~c45701_g1_i1.p1  ORF type:complete len:259 (+),score=35.09 c45701_g1_i1:35-778(+)